MSFHNTEEAGNDCINTHTSVLPLRFNIQAKDRVKRNFLARIQNPYAIPERSHDEIPHNENELEALQQPRHSHEHEHSLKDLHSARDFHQNGGAEEDEAETGHCGGIHGAEDGENTCGCALQGHVH